MGSSERWGALPLGELHPKERCAYCGSATAPTWIITLPMTHARARTCIDTSACERRRQKMKA